MARGGRDMGEIWARYGRGDGQGDGRGEGRGGGGGGGGKGGGGGGGGGGVKGGRDGRGDVVCHLSLEMQLQSSLHQERILHLHMMDVLPNKNLNLCACVCFCANTHPRRCHYLVIE